VMGAAELQLVLDKGIAGAESASMYPERSVTCMRAPVQVAEAVTQEGRAGSGRAESSPVSVRASAARARSALSRSRAASVLEPHQSKPRSAVAIRRKAIQTRLRKRLTRITLKQEL